jgi:hypothetical protein
VTIRSHGLDIKVKRKPAPEERQAATRLAQALRKVSYPSRAKTKVMVETPPGRVNARAARNAQFQRQKRVEQTAKPFRTQQRAKTIHTQMRVGIGCDISGSMRPAEEPLAVARWVLADALHQVNGEVATVLFGNDSHGVQAPRERLTDIEVFSHNGGSEDYIGGFSMLDSALDLIDGDGARLLVLITDGHFVRQDAAEYAEVTMDMCKRAGVAVIWLDMNGYFAREDGYGHGTVLNVAGKSPVEVADLLGRAVIDAFKSQATQHSLLAA